MLVRDVMVKPCTVSGDDLATKARALFKRRGVRKVYVVDSKFRLAGVLDRDDVINLRSKRSDLTSKGISLGVPVALLPQTPILDAARMLVGAGAVDAPVVDDRGRIAGQVDANLLVWGFLQKGYVPKAAKASEFMTKKVVSVAYDEPIETVVSKLEKHRSLPVLKGKRIVGMLTAGDVIRHGKFSRQKSTSVERIMKTPTVSVKAGDDTVSVAGILVKNNFNALPVVDGGGSLKGIVTRHDLLRAYTKG